MAKLDGLFAAAVSRASPNSSHECTAHNQQQCVRDELLLASRFYRYLHECAAMARQRWTKFDVPLMSLGLIIIAATCLLHGLSLIFEPSLTDFATGDGFFGA